MADYDLVGPAGDGKKKPRSIQEQDESPTSKTQRLTLEALSEAMKRIRRHEITISDLAQENAKLTAQLAAKG
jgi:hypothetical protein